MKEEGSKASKILAISGIILGVLAVGLAVVSKKYGRNVKKKSESINENTDQPTQDKTEPRIVDQRRNENYSKLSFESPYDLILYATRSVLKEGTFRDPSEFMSKVVSSATILCESDEWFAHFPKNIDELKEILEENNLLQEYNVIIYKNYM